MNNNGYYTQPDPPMKWHKFLIYFSLWAGALINFFNGLQLLNGSIYQGNADQVYSVFSGLKTMDMIFGIIYFAITIYMIYVRFQLAGFKQGAPGKLITVYIIQLVAPFAYYLMVSIVSHLPWSEVFDFTMIPSVIVSIAMIFVNRYYYSKRAHLFVN